VGKVEPERAQNATRVHNSTGVSIKLISIKSGCNLLHQLFSSSVFLSARSSREIMHTPSVPPPPL